MHLAHVIAVGAVVAVLGCGGGTPTGNNDTGTLPPPAPGTVDVSIKDFAFSADSISIKAGTTVRWTNTSNVNAHTSVSDDGTTWNSGSLASPVAGNTYGGSSTGGSFSFKFDQPGTFRYHCQFHPPTNPAYANFRGVVVVTQ
ncbi:MAG TPA: plastocyanin/azurin family copper-binding protein [Gemmatimonadaceae bacterium]|nr:plastocyanin/azurin family copper-binding protein [Gemmatimonadaceae bacterium]